jgi:hypothetical protein
MSGLRILASFSGGLFGFLLEKPKPYTDWRFGGQEKMAAGETARAGLRNGELHSFYGLRVAG